MNDAQNPAAPAEPQPHSPRLRWLNWSSLFLAVIQSLCTAFVALSGIRLFIGAAAFASAAGILKLGDRLHADAIRIPMMLIALVGSIVNLLALWQVWRLRRRSASAWRRQPVAPGKLRSERFQLALSVLTLLLLAAEWAAHWKLFGHE
jgi:hypothetical protein